MANSSVTARALPTQPAPAQERLEVVVADAGAPGAASLDVAARAVAVHCHGAGVVHALTDVAALAGFRPADEVAHLVDLLDCAQLRRVRLRMHAVPDAADPRLAATGALLTVLSWPREPSGRLVASVARCARAAVVALEPGTRDDDARRALTRVAELARAFPTDPAVLAPLFLAPHVIERGHALLLPTGAPHAILSGTALRFTPAGGTVAVAGLRRRIDPITETRRAALAAIQPLAASADGPVPAAPGHLTLVGPTAAAALTVDAVTGLPRMAGVAGRWTLIATDALLPLARGSVGDPRRR